MAAATIIMFSMLIVLFLGVVLRLLFMLRQNNEAVEIDILDVETWGPEIGLQDPLCEDK